MIQTTAEYVQTLMGDRDICAITLLGGYAQHRDFKERILFPPGALTNARYDIKTGALKSGLFTFPDGSTINYKRSRGS